MLNLYKLTVDSLIDFWNASSDPEWGENSIANSFYTYEILNAVDDFLKETPCFYERKPEYKLQPGNYGEQSSESYNKELINDNLRRNLYISRYNVGGAYKEYNIFISASVDDTLYLSLLLSNIFKSKDVFKSYINNKIDKEQLNSILSDELKYFDPNTVKFDVDTVQFDVNINPFKLKENDIVTIGLLFTYSICED